MRRMVILSEDSLQDAIEELTGERDRARALAAKLEEVVAMRETALRSLLSALAQEPISRATRIGATIAWAEAQLSEVP